MGARQWFLRVSQLAEGNIWIHSRIHYGRCGIKWLNDLAMCSLGFGRCCRYVISQGQIDLFMWCVKYFDVNVASPSISFFWFIDASNPIDPMCFPTRWCCYILPGFFVSTKIAHLRSSTISTTDFHGESGIIHSYLWILGIVQHGSTWYKPSSEPFCTETCRNSRPNQGLKKMKDLCQLTVA